MLSLIVDETNLFYVTRAPVLSLIVDRVEPILCNKSTCAVFDCRQSRTFYM